MLSLPSQSAAEAIMLLRTSFPLDNLRLLSTDHGLFTVNDWSSMSHLVTVEPLMVPEQDLRTPLCVLCRP
jgi:hypothetical protein